MKKILLVVISFLFMSCEFELYEYIIDDFNTRFLFKDIPVSTAELPELNNKVDISKYIRSKIKYKRIDRTYGWDEAVKVGYGDCKHYALGFADILYRTTGIKADIVVVDNNPGRIIVNGGNNDHAMISINGIVYSPLSGEPTPDNLIGYIYYFEDVFLLH